MATGEPSPRNAAISGIRQAVTGHRPPWPNNMNLAMRYLSMLEAEKPQSPGQRTAREKLYAACEAYEEKDEAGAEKETKALKDAWHNFEIRWCENYGD